jgi:hypothetical protein
LINLKEENKEKLELIEKSVFVIILEDKEVHNMDEVSRLGLIENPKNRYFDKSYQTIVTKNGVYLSNIEVSQNQQNIIC